MFLSLKQLSDIVHLSKIVCKLLPTFPLYFNEFFNVYSRVCCVVVFLAPTQLFPQNKFLIVELPSPMT